MIKEVFCKRLNKVIIVFYLLTNVQDTKSFDWDAHQFYLRHSDFERVHRFPLTPLSRNNCSTAKNTVISPDFLVWKFCRKAQFPHSFGRIARNYMEIVPFRKISTPGNQVILRYFSYCSYLVLGLCQTAISKLFCENSQHFFATAFA